MVYLLLDYIWYVYQILDFGLARATDQEMTGYVATRYWRAPEIMLSWMHYGKEGMLHEYVHIHVIQVCTCYYEYVHVHVTMKMYMYMLP